MTTAIYYKGILAVDKQVTSQFKETLTCFTCNTKSNKTYDTIDKITLGEGKKMFNGETVVAIVGSGQVLVSNSLISQILSGADFVTILNLLPAASLKNNVEIFIVTIDNIYTYIYGDKLVKVNPDECASIGSGSDKFQILTNYMDVTAIDLVMAVSYIDEGTGFGVDYIDLNSKDRSVVKHVPLLSQEDLKTKILSQQNVNHVKSGKKDKKKLSLI